MKYCYNCNRITPSQPLFCNYCGRSYDVKLCPRLHPNPRKAEACSQCGSRDLSIPQPKVPFWASVIQLTLSLLPGLVLAVLSVGVVAVLITALVQDPRLLASALLLLIPLGVLWWMWSQIPGSIRKAISNLMRRRREGDGKRKGR